MLKEDFGLRYSTKINNRRGMKEIYKYMYIYIYILKMNDKGDINYKLRMWFWYTDILQMKRGGGVSKGSKES
jgi:hypothetical protein